MTKGNKVFITDCEGPVSKNDNAFELTKHFIPEGEYFFTQVSKYDDVQADIVKRKNYKAGDTLKLIVPFLKAYDVTDNKIMEFSKQNIMLMSGAKETLQFLNRVMPSFIVSTSYEHYIQALCQVLDFPFEKAYCTTLNIDSHKIGREEREKIKQLKQEICKLPLIKIPEGVPSLLEFSETDKKTIRRLDEIFWKEIIMMESGKMLEEVDPVGGFEKAKAAEEIVDDAQISFDRVMYVGDSITDVECFRLVRQNSGLTISFNGNNYAVREAEVAVLSTNAMIIAVIADVFNRLGKKAVFQLIRNWNYKSLEKHNVNKPLLVKLQGVFPETLPKVVRITANNVEELVSESSAFRKLVRGEKIGQLG